MRFLFFILLLFSFPKANAQLSTAEIKKYKIRQLTETQVFPDDSITNITVTWYDNTGRDTARLFGGSRYQIAYEFDKQGRLTKKINFDAFGFESSSQVYRYNKNGSYRIDYWYLLGDNQVYEIYDSLGRLDEEQLKAGYKLFYTYDDKGRKLKVMTMLAPAVKGNIIHLLYTYDEKGRLKKEISLGSEKWEKDFFYDASGRLVKTTHKGAEITVNEFVYSDAGLIVKITELQTDRQGMNSRNFTTFDYKFK